MVEKLVEFVKKKSLVELDFPQIKIEVFPAIVPESLCKRENLAQHLKKCNGLCYIKSNNYYVVYGKGNTVAVPNHCIGGPFDKGNMVYWSIKRQKLYKSRKVGPKVGICVGFCNGAMLLRVS